MGGGGMLDLLYQFRLSYKYTYRVCSCLTYRHIANYVTKIRYRLPYTVNINNVYMRALSYAEEISISCPSLNGFNIMLDICNHIVHIYFILLTQRKL